MAGLNRRRRSASDDSEDSVSEGCRASLRGVAANVVSDTVRHPDGEALALGDWTVLDRRQHATDVAKVPGRGRPSAITETLSCPVRVRRFRVWFEIAVGGGGGG